MRNTGNPSQPLGGGNTAGRRISRRVLVLLAGAVVLAAVAGCMLISGTFRVSHDFPTGEKRSTGTDVRELGVDLNEDKDYKDNKDKIKSIDEVGFVFQAKNNPATGANAEIWLSENPITPSNPPNLTPEDIRGSASAKRVLGGLVLPAEGTVDVTYEQSLGLEENVDFLHETVKGGKFYLYGIADTDNFDISIDKFTVVVVLTAEL